MKTTTEVLRSLVADIEAMKAKGPTEDRDGWFGGFGEGWLDDNQGYYINWPNLGILLEEANQALQTVEHFGGVEGIKRCLKVGNDAPLLLVLGEKEK